MSEPITFRVVQSLQAALRAIATRDGYHHDIEGVAVKLDPNQDVETLLGDDQRRPFIVLELQPERVTYQPAMRVRTVVPATIHAVHESDPTDDDSWLRVYTRLCADVERAIAVDITRGGLAVDTRIATFEFHALGGRQVWAMVQLELAMLRAYGSPNG